jgi:hypothetical protein
MQFRSARENYEQDSSITSTRNTPKSRDPQTKDWDHAYVVVCTQPIKFSFREDDFEVGDRRDIIHCVGFVGVSLHQCLPLSLCPH